MNEMTTGLRTLAANFKAPKANPASTNLRCDLFPRPGISGSMRTVLRRGAKKITSAPTKTAAAIHATGCCSNPRDGLVLKSSLHPQGDVDAPPKNAQITRESVARPRNFRL